MSSYFYTALHVDSHTIKHFYQKNVSNFGIGAVLSLLDKDGNDHILIAYHVSRGILR